MEYFYTGQYLFLQRLGTSSNKHMKGEKLLLVQLNESHHKHRRFVKYKIKLDKFVADEIHNVSVERTFH